MFKNKFILSVFLILLSANLLAQNNTNSPYTRFGYGELADYSSGISKGMGGVSLGLRTKSSVNTANPASYTSIDSMTFIFEVGAMGRQSCFSGGGLSSNAFSANIEYLTLEFPIAKYFAFSAGLLPYSFVGYDYSIKGVYGLNGTNEQIEYTQSFSGTGGASQVYGGFAAKLGNHLSLGINVSYLFGSIKNSRQLDFDEVSTYVGSLQTSNMEISDLNLRYGIQYYADIKENKTLTLGLVLETKSKLGGTFMNENYTINYLMSNQSVLDTAFQMSNADFELPLTIGAGVSFGQKNKYVVGADVLFQNFSDARCFGVKDSLQDRLKVSLGGEYQPNRNAKNYFKRMSYRAGANVSTGYLKENGESPLNYGITFGIGLPTRGRSMVNLAFEYGKIGSNSQIKEDYFKFSINANFIETWFFKRRFD